MTTTSTYPQIIGTRPTGPTTTHAERKHRWATITQEDNTLTVTGYEGWGILDQVRLSGAVAQSMAVRIAHDLITL